MIMTFLNYIEAIVAIVALIVWLVRLEGKLVSLDRFASETQKDVDVLRTKHEGLDSKIVMELGEVKIILARLEERLGIKKGIH